SSLAATLLCAHFRCRNLLFSGVAGGLDPALEVGDVVIGERVIQHDYGALHDSGLMSYRPGTIPIGERQAPLAFETDAGLLERARGALASLSLPVLPAAATGEAPRQPRVHFGTIVSGDQFINNETARRRLFADFAGQAGSPGARATTWTCSCGTRLPSAPTLILAAPLAASSACPASAISSISSARSAAASSWISRRLARRGTRMSQGKRRSFISLTDDSGPSPSATLAADSRSCRMKSIAVFLLLLFSHEKFVSWFRSGS